MFVFCTRTLSFVYFGQSSGFVRGPGDNPKPIAFSFHDKFKQGPLLSVVCHLLSFSPSYFSASGCWLNRKSCSGESNCMKRSRLYIPSHGNI